MRRKTAVCIGIAVCVVVCFIAVLLAYNQLAWHVSEQMPDDLGQRASTYEVDTQGSLVNFGPSYSCGGASCMPVLEAFFTDVPRNAPGRWSFTTGILTSWDNGDKPFFKPQPVLTKLTLELNLSSENVILISSGFWREAGKNTYSCTLDRTQLEAAHGYIDAPIGTLVTAGDAPFPCEATVTATGTIKCGLRTFNFTISDKLGFYANL